MSRMVYELEQVKGETLDSVKAVAGKPMGFLHSSAIEESMNGCTFDPNNFKKGKKPLDVYLVLPPWAIESYRVWLRATLDSFIQAILRHGPDERKLVHLKLDEMAAIMSGKMPVLTRALDQGRKYGLRIAGYWQGTSQLNEAFPIDHGQTWRSNTTAVYFAVNDLQTAKDLNQELGKETILVKGWRKGSGRSHQGRADGVADHATYGTSSDSGEDEHQKERDLLTPDEILSLSERVVIARVPGMKPVWATLLRSYEEKWLWKRQSKIGKSLQMLFDSIIVLI